MGLASVLFYARRTTTVLRGSTTEPEYINTLLFVYTIQNFRPVQVQVSVLFVIIPFIFGRTHTLIGIDDCNSEVVVPERDFNSTQYLIL